MKTPQEKAEDLVEKFTDIENEYNEYSDFKQAKQCALIAVDEIIEILSFDLGHDNTSRYLCEYFKEVKTSIKKL
jgi:hypothetical protein